MAITNRERIDKALEHLRDGLIPFVERELRSHLGKDWLATLDKEMQYPLERNADGTVHWDTQKLLKVMWDCWRTVFAKTFGHSERNYVSELTTVRNRHAHEERFSYEDTERSLDTIRRLLKATSAEDGADAVGELRTQLVRVQQAEEARRDTRKASLVAGTPQAGLKPWREVITPHADVASGHYLQAEFAADLAKVHKGTAPSEYSDAREFFSRTFITDGLRELLEIGMRRLTGQGGDPVIELQTNFGGGKTHSMLALYHLFGGGKAADLPGIEDLLGALDVKDMPTAKRVVLVGTAITPHQPSTKKDGTKVRTLWGELAWQLGGKEGYAHVAASDKSGTSPGSDVLEDLLKAFSPCLILIDEWVAFLRQLPGKDDLEAGSYDANITFVQALTEAVKAAPRALVVASLPVSAIEIGGTHGEMALKTLSNVFKRIAKPWRPASTDEGFEIVRRRLFEGTMDYGARDATVKAFADMYYQQAGEFPSECREAGYRRRLEACYPVHPDLFDRLDKVWSPLDKFQRTRGVLRMMASVIHALWEANDGSLLIMPSSVALNTGPVRSLITECLPDGYQWEGVLSSDVDGPSALPLEIDRGVPNLGRYSAARRVARTIFMGSAPTIKMDAPGIEDQRMLLGCVQPGEPTATFNDALRRLTDKATYMYVNRGRTWFALSPSVTRMAQERAQQLQDDPAVDQEIVRRLREEEKAQKKNRGDFAGVHTAPEDASEVEDRMEARLVVLGPQHAHSRNTDDSPARLVAADILARRGTTPRDYPNALVFLAPEQKVLKDLRDSVRQYLAWKGIHEEAQKDQLDLTMFAKNQAREKMEQADRECQVRLNECWAWALVPRQPDATAAGLAWDEFSLPGGGPMAGKVSRKLVNQEALFPVLGAPRLAMELDRYLWKEKDSVNLKQMLHDFAKYLFLPRLTGEHVLRTAVEGGFTGAAFCEHFAYATGWDEGKQRYTGLQTTTLKTPVQFDGESRLVKPEAAERQLEAENEEKEKTGGSGAGGNGGQPTNGGGGKPLVGGKGGTSTVEEPPQPPRRFHGSVMLPASKAGLKFSEIAQEVIQHFSSDVGTKVTIRVEIDAERPDGFSEQVIRTVRENGKTLGFKVAEFETE